MPTTHPVTTHFARPLLALLVCLTAWVGAADAQHDDCLRPPSPRDVRLTIEPRADNALIVEARVELSRSDPAYVEYGNDQLGWLRTPTSAAAVEHRLPLVRLRAETAYRARAYALDVGGCVGGIGTAEFSTGPLPSGLEQIEVETSGRAGFPLAVMDLQPRLGERRWLVSVDRAGQLVWYYRVPDEIPFRGTFDGFVFSLVRLPSGNWLYAVGDYGFEEVTPDARSVRRIELAGPMSSRIHHDFTLAPDGRVLLLGAETRRVATRGRELPVRGDTLHALDLASGAEEQLWSTFDLLDLSQRPLHWRNVKPADDIERGDVADWTHTNTIHVTPRGSLLLSMRHLDQVISIAPDLRTVEWKLGGLGSSFDFPDPADRFYGQHAPVELPNGHILLFDNGNFRPEGEYSRGLELELDFGAMAARKVWEYRHPTDDYSSRVGNALRLPTGNTLLNFGYHVDPTSAALLVEARPDGTAAWVASMKAKGSRTTRYRAYPLESLAGEMPVEAVSGRP